MPNTYITDRTASDCQRIHTIYNKLLNGTASASEISQWNAGLKGALNMSDLSRLADIYDDLRTRADATGSFYPVVYSYTPSVMKTWVQSTKITKQMLNNYLIANAQVLKTAVGSDEPLPAKVKTFSDLNKIETILLDTDFRIEHAPSVVDKPTNLTPTSYYSGSEITNGYTYDPAKISMVGQDRGTEIGTYSATYTPINGYVWRGDQTTNPITVTLTIRVNSSIGPKPVSPSPATYSGSVITNGYTTPEHVTMTGNNSGTNVGSYVATYTPDEGYCWSDDTRDAVSVTLTINALYLTIPSLVSSVVAYTGSAVSPEVSNFNSTYEVQGGTSSATAGGTYQITWSLRNATNTHWSDGTVSDKTATWTIQYVWEKWDTVTSYTPTTEVVTSQAIKTGSFGYMYRLATGYTFSSVDGTYTLSGGSAHKTVSAGYVVANDTAPYCTDPEGYSASNVCTTMWQVGYNSSASLSNVRLYCSNVKFSRANADGVWAIKHSSVLTPAKGDTQLGYEQSQDISAYPENGYQDGYWYVKTW